MRRSSFIRTAAAPVLGSVLRGRARAAVPVRFITVASESGASPEYAARAGFFKAAGVDVTVTSLASGGAVLPAVLGGSANFGVSNPISLGTAFERGAPLTCIAATAYYQRSDPNSLLMVTNDSPLRVARDLDGQTVAVNGLRNTSQLSVEAWVDDNGGDSKTLKFVEIPFPEMIGALEAGRVAAAFYAEPSLGEVRERLRVFGDAYGALAAQFSTGAFFTSVDYAKAQPDVVSRVATALRRAAAWANTHHQETAVIVAQIEKLPLERVERMKRSVYVATPLARADLQPCLDVAVRYGVLAKPLDAQAMIWAGA